MNLLIDDIRDLDVDVIARTGEAGLNVLATMKFETVFFDHDLGDGITGLETLKIAILRGQLNKSQIILVTSNPVGRKNMEYVLIDNNFKNNKSG